MIKDFPEYLFKVIDMCRRKEWENKFNQNQTQILDVLCNLHKLSQEEVVESILNIDECIESQMMGFLMITFISKYFNDGSNVVDAYLKRFKHRMSRDEMKFYAGLKNIYFSIYKIIDVKPEKYSIIKDVLFDTNEIKVLEGSANNEDIIGRHVLASVFEDEGEYYYTGIFLPIDEKYLEEMIAPIKKELKSAKISYKNRDLVPIDEVRTFLYKYYPIFFYYVFRPCVIEPTIINDNGDEFKPKVCKFKINDINKNKERISDILTSLFDKKEYQILEEDENWWSLFLLRKSAKKLKKSELTEEDYILYGEIRLEDEYLKTTVLYSNQMNYIIQIFKKNLKDMIGMAVIEDLNIDNAEASEELASNDIKEKIPEEVKNEFYKTFFDKHLKELLNVKIPELNNLTPKQCLKKDPKTFHKWLNTLKQELKTVTEGSYDVTWFLDELGIK